MVHTSDFFDHLQDHSEIKLRILDKFAVPWAAKLGYKAGLRGGRKLWYVDGFAGPGRYEDGSEGSPIIGASHALELVKQSRPYALGCVNVESNRRRFDSLERETASFSSQGVEIHNLHCDFSDCVPRILEIIGRDDPCFVFIDPFGIKPLAYPALKDLVARPGEVDLMLVFQSRAVSRLVTGHPEYVTGAVGADDWLDRWDLLGVEAVYGTLKRSLLADGHFRSVERYGVRAEKSAAPRYHMVIGSRSYHAFQLLNDMICQEERQLDQKSYARVAQASFLPQVDDITSQQELVNTILTYGRTHPRTTRRQIVEHIVLSHWANWHTGDIRRAVGGLIEADTIVRHKGKRPSIDTDLLEFRL